MTVKSNPIYRFLTGLRDFAGWVKRGYAAPSPHFIKQACLLRNGFSDATWIESGTFLGQTTQLLARNAIRVYSIEPDNRLFLQAKALFSKQENIKIINGTSEDVFPELLPIISGDINFWLDGHYSGGVTFKGAKDTPIIDELTYIGCNINRYDKVCVLVDDIRCFKPWVS
ncbi:MAG: hypothetical protein O3B03_03905 [Proteobacteria bacterium]|nr:hypothetical protein [Pseudomonadota bacterium]